jgi:predicted transport protein
METEFGQEAYATQFDAFVRHYLTVRTGDIPNVREVYDAFKKYARSEGAGNTEALVADIREYSRYYCAMALGAETDSELKLVFQDIRELKVDVAFPFLLELYKDYASGTLSKSDFASAARLVEAYVFRRAICSIPTNSLNKTFSMFSKALRKDAYLESIQAHLLTLPSYRRFPDDEEFARELQLRDLYNFPRRSYFLRRLENAGRKERVPTESFSIEHIMPQNPNLSPQWKADLGPEWQRIQKTYLHTLGNLTLTGYNSEYSDRPFAEKRDIEGGFAQSPLHLNEVLRTCQKWDEPAIRQRAATLAKRASTVWGAPELDEASLEKYQPKPDEGPVKYSIEDHPHLASGAMREVFEAFRRAVLAIDPTVVEEFKKLYVAYKAETNFVDVIPQAKRLVLSLNIDPHVIDDPRGLTRDVTNLGRWGNGNTEVALSSLDELPYVIGLVGQAFEQQIAEDS